MSKSRALTKQPPPKQGLSFTVTNPFAGWPRWMVVMVILWGIGAFLWPSIGHPHEQCWADKADYVCQPDPGYTYDDDGNTVLIGDAD